MVFGDSHAFGGVPDINLVEVLPIALIAGPIFGIIAALYMIGLRQATRIVGRTGLSPSQLLFLGAILTGLVGMAIRRFLALEQVWFLIC